MSEKEFLDKLRDYIVHRPQVVSQLSLTENRAKIVRHVSKRPNSTANDVARVFNTSQQSAGQTLRRLTDLGYLWRTETLDPTGGVLYEYNARVKPWKQ